MNERPKLFACYDHRFMLRVLAAAFVLVALGIGSRALGLERGSPLRLAFAAAQVAALGYSIWITVGAIRRLDEMQHRVQLEAIAFAFAVSAIVMTGWGFLAKAGLPPIAWGAETWIAMLGAWALGLFVARRRYR